MTSTDPNIARIVELEAELLAAYRELSKQYFTSKVLYDRDVWRKAMAVRYPVCSKGDRT